jgi:hypothetical protein
MIRASTQINFTVDEKTSIIGDDVLLIKDSEDEDKLKEIKSSLLKIADKIRVANSAPLTPVEGDVYVDSVDNAFYLAVD